MGSGHWRLGTRHYAQDSRQLAEARARRIADTACVAGPSPTRRHLLPLGLIITHILDWTRGVNVRVGKGR